MENDKEDCDVRWDLEEGGRRLSPPFEVQMCPRCHPRQVLGSERQRAWTSDWPNDDHRHVVVSTSHICHPDHDRLGHRDVEHEDVESYRQEQQDNLECDARILVSKHSHNYSQRQSNREVECNKDVNLFVQLCYLRNYVGIVLTATDHQHVVVLLPLPDEQPARNHSGNVVQIKHEHDRVQTVQKILL